ncbi:MAG: elongation factor Ts [Deltaproteobacteria bacterium]|nr:elongation factor Ts [Deltaproteobacteria bacterium]
MAITAKQVNELRQKTGAGIMDCKRALAEVDGDVDKAITLLREKGMASAGKKSARVAAEGKVEAISSGRQAALVEINCETDFVARGEAFLDFVGSVSKRVLESDGEEIDPAFFEQERKALVASIGENVVIRRIARFQLESGLHGRVETYLHMGGKIGVMVEVACGSEQAAESEAFQSFCREITMQVAAANPQYLQPDEVPQEELDAERAIYRKQALDSGKSEQHVDKIVEGRLRKWYGEFCLLQQPYIREQKQTVDAYRKQVAKQIGADVSVRRFARFQLGEGIEKRKDDLAEEVKKQVEAAKKG